MPATTTRTPQQVGAVPATGALTDAAFLSINAGPTLPWILNGQSERCPA